MTEPTQGKPIAYYDKDLVFKESLDFPEASRIFITSPNTSFGFLYNLPNYGFTVFKISPDFAKQVFQGGIDVLNTPQGEGSGIIVPTWNNQTPYHMINYPDGYYVIKVNDPNLWNNVKKNIKIYTKTINYDFENFQDFGTGKTFLLFFPLCYDLHRFVDSKFERSDYLIINRCQEKYSFSPNQNAFKNHVDFLIDQLNDNSRFSNFNKFYIIVKTIDQTKKDLLKYINISLYHDLLSKGLFFNIVKVIENQIEGERERERERYNPDEDEEDEGEEEIELDNPNPIEEDIYIYTPNPQTTFEKYRDSYKTWIKSIFKDGLYFVPNYKSVIININVQLENLMENFKHIIQHQYFENRFFMTSKESKNKKYLKWLHDNNGNNTVVSWLIWLGFSIKPDRHVLKISHRKNINEIKFDEIMQSYQFIYQIFLNPNLIHLTEKSLFPFLRDGNKPKTYDSMITQNLADLEAEKNFFGHYITMFKKYKDLFDEYDLSPLKHVSLKYFLQELYKFTTFIIPNTKKRLGKIYNELNMFRVGLMTCDPMVKKMYISYDISRYKESMYEKFVKFKMQVHSLFKYFITEIKKLHIQPINETFINMNYTGFVDKVEEVIKNLGKVIDRVLFNFKYSSNDDKSEEIIILTHCMGYLDILSSLERYKVIEGEEILYENKMKCKDFINYISKPVYDYIDTQRDLNPDQKNLFTVFLTNFIKIEIFGISRKNKITEISNSFDKGFETLNQTFQGLDYQYKQSMIRYIKKKKEKIIEIMTGKKYYNWYFHDKLEMIKVVPDNNIKIIIEDILHKLKDMIPGEEVAQLQTLINEDDEFEYLINDYFEYDFRDEEDVDQILELLRNYMFMPNIGEIPEMVKFYKKLIMIKHYYKGKTEPVENYKKLVSELNYEIHKLLSYMKKTKTSMLLGVKNNKELEDRYLNLKGKYLNKKLVAMESKANTEKTFKNFKRFTSKLETTDTSNLFFKKIKSLKKSNKLKYDFYLAILFRVWQTTIIPTARTARTTIQQEKLEDIQRYFDVKLDSVKSLVINNAILHEVIETFFMKENKNLFSFSDEIQKIVDNMQSDDDPQIQIQFFQNIIKNLNTFDSEKQYQK